MGARSTITNTRPLLSTSRDMGGGAFGRLPMEGVGALNFNYDLRAEEAVL
jgi:hypothetical protein